MHWNKVSEVGFPKLPDGVESILCICAVKRLTGEPKSHIYKYEKTYTEGKTAERWKDYYGDYYIRKVENIIAWMPVPQYDPNTAERGRTLLKASEELMKRLRNDPDATVHYDDADCDYACLVNDIEAWLETDC